MELLPPIERLEDWQHSALDARQVGESGQPQRLNDLPQQVATLVGRQNVSYDHVWAAAEAAYPKWQPVRCTNYRRAVLLAGAAIQHRSRAFDVHRRGKLVCIRFVPTAQEETAPSQAAASA